MEMEIMLGWVPHQANGFPILLEILIVPLPGFHVAIEEKALYFSQGTIDTIENEQCLFQVQ